MHVSFKSTVTAGLLGFVTLAPITKAGEASLPSQKYQVLAPISQGNLTVFPVVASNTHDTAKFLTLDEGLRSGEVVVTEAGQRPGMVRRRGLPPPQQGGADVNRLFIVNNSKRPLVLLAGEIVTGGKQDRVVGKDRIIPAGSDADMSVFCVEPGRWAEMRTADGRLQTNFDMAGLVQPSVRGEVMAKKDQQKVWDEVNRANNEMGAVAGARGSMGGPTTSSYGRNANSPAMKEEVDKVVRPIERSYQSLIGELRDRKAVGVVVAVNGDIIWADIFASPALLEKYWPKLVRSYAAEALTHRVSGGATDREQARAFLARLDGNHEQTDTEPGVYRHTEISGSGYKVFELTSLLPGTGFEVHVSKMAE
jgi:ARG and Rhodanese-Phosphatase-superfamily-associated Protein domain